MTLAQLILRHSNNYHTVWKDFQFDFEDSVVTITGVIHEDWSVDQGNYWIPPYYLFEARQAYLESVSIDGRVFTRDELDELEKQIEDER